MLYQLGFKDSYNEIHRFKPSIVKCDAETCLFEGPEVLPAVEDHPEQPVAQENMVELNDEHQQLQQAGIRIGLILTPAQIAALLQQVANQDCDGQPLARNSAADRKRKVDDDGAGPPTARPRLAQVYCHEIERLFLESINSYKLGHVTDHFHGNVF